ncbi:ATP-binding protein [Taylorella asinigenitalis]|uniref:Phage protein n=1 Tax=Taylorella asinigenitalis (strain MCE3) TaxID=1008459 RepID=G4QCR6_TAYAM|nr:ATP-binding protein [Taylorella asinigenitalis]AEP36196.1 phage protein [Taylorella asinigenitalis MCE3]
MQFNKATRKKAKLRLALIGASGAGKTYSALLIAKGLGGKVAVIDTENGSASLYSHLLDFDVLELTPPYSPERYIEAIKTAEKAGYDVLIIDSVTHEWNGAGGVLELVEDIAKAKYRGNSLAAWGELTPRHRAFLDAMVQSPLHIIATARSKSEVAIVQDGGKARGQKVGTKTEQRDGFEFEFTTVLEIDHATRLAMASKDRTGIFNGVLETITEETGKRLINWLNAGSEPVKESEEKPNIEYASIDVIMNCLETAENAERLEAIYRRALKKCDPKDVPLIETAYKNYEEKLGAMV